MPQTEAFYTSDCELNFPALTFQILPKENLGFCKWSNQHQKYLNTKDNIQGMRTSESNGE